ncbi:hypothetical protein Bhyg_03864 [Pseudolycoriella hygida]|uniref:Uncharacterized protein n=1 Tax=Pseudolycoriella hygida TaxID=35572 RepID=A0A9Q0NE38_9DIPT|nr:hypothetical protein Bhyg_03864 [Pseudolycoriella hygida]
MVFRNKFILIALAAAAFCCSSVNSQVVTAATAAELIKLATEYGAPFAKTGLDRLHSEIFGSDVAARSTDVIIFNKSGKSFKLIANDCEHGGWATGLMPEHEVQGKQSTVFQMQSHGVMTGVKCLVTYKTNDGIFFELLSDNPYFGKNWVSESHSSSLIVTSTRGVGNNNQVRFVIEDA